MYLKIRVGNYVIFHVKTNFPFQYVDWVVMSKDIILHSGRENGDNIHPEISRGIYSSIPVLLISDFSSARRLLKGFPKAENVGQFVQINVK